MLTSSARTPRRRLRRPALLILTVAGFIAALFGLPSCQLATPFAGPGYSPSRGVTLPDVGDSVIVAVTHAHLDPDNRRPFDDYTRHVIRSLSDNDGYIGHSVRARVFGHEVWTLTVWRDEPSLDAFVRSPTHRAAIREGLSGVTTAQFMRFTSPTSDVPPRWNSILQRLKSVEFIDYSQPSARSPR